MGKGRSRRSRKTKPSARVAAGVTPPATRFVIPALTRSSWIAVTAILAATLVAFAPALRAPFEFDDVASIPNNPTIQHVFPLSTPLHPPPRAAVSGRPASNVSLAVDHAVSDALGLVDRGGGAPDSSSTVVYHATNLLLHLFCGLLLFGIVRRTLSLASLSGWVNANAESIGLVSMALWLVHPIQTEAVDYVVQRTELLVSACYLGTLYASIRAWDAATPRRRGGWLLAGVVACAIGMASKEVMATAPFVVAAYDRVFRVSSWRELASDRARRWFYGGLVATLVLLGILIAGGGRADSVGFGLGLPWYRYLYSQGWAIAHYLQLLVWPRDLRFDYGFQPVRGVGGLVGGCVVLAIAAGLLLFAWRGKRWWLAFLVLWFFALLAPSSSVVPINTEIAAERRVYLASAAVIVGIAVAAAYALRHRRRLFLGGSAVVAGMLVVVASRRSRLYAKPESLWRDAVVKAPDNPRAYDNLASVIYASDRRRVGEADSLWTRSIAIDSMYMTAWSNLAQIRMDAGRVPEARALLEHALRINPDYVDATRRLGGLLARQGDSTSIPYLERMASSTEATDELFVTLAQAYADANRPADAMTALRRALTLNPHRADAAALLGGMLAQQGAMGDALPYLESAAAHGNRNGMTFALLSLGYAQQQRADESVRAAQQAVIYGGSNAQIDIIVGRAMIDVGRLTEAEAYLTEATRSAPNDPEAVTRLGIVMAARGEMARAIELFRRALKVAPGYSPAVQALAKAGAK